MQKIATKVFICASVVFGVLGLSMVLTGTEPDDSNSGLQLVVARIFISSIFVILTSFALSVAGKYLQNK
jgi:hypothetical protein